VANASVALALQPETAASVLRIERALHTGLKPAHDLEGVVDVRVLGAIGEVQMRDPVDMAAAIAAAVDRGVWLRPFRDLIYTMPPYVATDDDVADITAAVVAAAASCNDAANAARG
jgi:adenosylmethionine-8-amino-7-oxononanoate aminotransferase